MPSSPNHPPFPDAVCKSIVHDLDDALFIVDARWRIHWANRVGEALRHGSSVPSADLLYLLDGVSRAHMLLDGDAAVTNNGVWRGAGVLAVDGSPVDVTIRAVSAGDAGSWRTVRFTRTHDVRHLELRARDADRLEGIAHLSTALSHELNDLLTAITGASEILVTELPATNPLRADADAIQRAADRAAVLARQLARAAASRAPMPQLVDVARAVKAIEPMLSRELGRDIELRVDLAVAATMLSDGASHAPVAHLDVAQLEMAMQHLARNARTAMPGGGTVSLSLRSTIIETPRQVVHAVLRPGRYLVLAMRDSGVGMDANTGSHAFEPLYSATGGAGLGLSIVFGIATQMGGYVTCDTTRGLGTTISLYIPEAASERVHPLQREGAACVLLVEDEDAVRRVAARALRREGYHVVEAANGEEALETMRRRPSMFDLLLTDVVMPGMSGIELARRAMAASPGLRVLYSSGALGSAEPDTPRVPPGAAFLPKPFTPRALGARVRELLAG